MEQEAGHRHLLAPHAPLQRTPLPLNTTLWLPARLALSAAMEVLVESYGQHAIILEMPSRLAAAQMGVARWKPVSARETLERLADG